MYNRKKNSNLVVVYYTVDKDRVHKFYLRDGDKLIEEVYNENEVEDNFYFEPPGAYGDKYGRRRPIH